MEGGAAGAEKGNGDLIFLNEMPYAFKFQPTRQGPFRPSTESVRLGCFVPRFYWAIIVFYNFFFTFRVSLLTR